MHIYNICSGLREGVLPGLSFTAVMLETSALYALATTRASVTASGGVGCFGLPCEVGKLMGGVKV